MCAVCPSTIHSFGDRRCGSPSDVQGKAEREGPTDWVRRVEY
nr:hypothetical protein [Halostella sp. PRR32]